MDLPGYEIVGELGRGGMGMVYKARQIHLKRLVALKMILAGARAGPEELARFRLEAQAAARLDHPNIVRIYDFGEHQGLLYFSMELVTGGTLVQKMAGPPWPVDAAAGLIETLAQALNHAHQQHIVHRDLKPANVLFHQDGTPKVTDFGLAKQLDSSVDLTDTGRILGTLRYMAPEQAAGNPRAIGPATDVHALGAILYELLTGRSAYGGSNLLEVLERLRSSEPLPPRILRPELPVELERICLRCLQKDPGSRYQSAEELARALHDFLAGSSDQEVLPPAPPARPDGMDRSQWWRF